MTCYIAAMKVSVRRGLIWGGLFLFAYAAGSGLGRFVVAGLANGPNQRMAAAVAALPPPVQSAPQHQRPVAPPVVAPAYAGGNSGAHVCEGCDAGETRNRQIAQQLGLPYDEPADEAQSADAEKSAGRAAPQQGGEASAAQ